MLEEDDRRRHSYKNPSTLIYTFVNKCRHIVTKLLKLFLEQEDEEELYSASNARIVEVSRKNEIKKKNNMNEERIQQKKTQDSQRM